MDKPPSIGKGNSELFLKFIKEKLKDYFENIDFDINFHQNATVFFVKDVEIQKDILKRNGIPLELCNGSVKEIKITIHNIIQLSPILVEISGVTIDVCTLFLSHEYKNDYRSFKQRFLDQWEKIHREVFKIKFKDEEESRMEGFIIKCMSQLQAVVRDIRIVIGDRLTSTIERKKEQKLELRVGCVKSYGCKDDWKGIEESVNEGGYIRRIVEVQQIAVTIYRQKGDDHEILNISECFVQPFDSRVRIRTMRKREAKEKEKEAKMEIDVSIVNPLVVNVSIDKVEFLINLSRYLSKIQKVEKYWIHRPNMRDDFIFSKSDYVEWFKYAFNVTREEVMRKNQADKPTSLLENVVNMERYIHYYQASNKLLDSQALGSSDEKLKTLETHMNLEDILHCRENVFINLLTTWKSNNNNATENLNLNLVFEAYTNKYKSRWINKDDIYPKSNERREKEMQEKLIHEKDLLSLLKGDPCDLMHSIQISCDVIIINFSRKLAKRKKKELAHNVQELPDQMNFYNEIFLSQLDNIFSNEKKPLQLHFMQCIEGLSEEELKKVIKEEMKQVIKDIDSAEDEDLKEQKEEEENSSENEQDGDWIRSYKSFPTMMPQKRVVIQKFKNTPIIALNQVSPKVFVGKVPEKKVKVSNDLYSQKSRCKLLLSVVLCNLSVNQSLVRNGETSLEVKILSLSIIDHNFTYCIANKHTEYFGPRKEECEGEGYLTEIWEERSKSTPTSKSKSNQRVITCDLLDDTLRNFLLDLLYDTKVRDSMLTDVLVETEKEFIDQIDNQYGLKAINLAEDKNNMMLYELYSVLVKYLYQKGILDKFKARITKLLDKRHKFKNLLNDDETSFKISFIMRILEKYPDIKKKRLTSSFQINLAKSDSTPAVLLEKNRKSSVDFFKSEKSFMIGKDIFSSLFFQSVSSLTVRPDMQEDLNFLIKAISINLVQYSIASMYPYFMKNEAVIKIFNSNLKSFSMSVSHTNRMMNNLGNKARVSACFLDMTLTKEGISLKSEIKDHRQAKALIAIKRELSINLSTQTIAELVCLIPRFAKLSGPSDECTGNIVDDLKKSHIDIYDEFIELKNDFLHDLKAERNKKILQNPGTKPSQTQMTSDSMEMMYITNRESIINQLADSKLNITVKISRVTINLHDHVFFQFYEKFSSVNLTLAKVKFSNEKLRTLPYNEIQAQEGKEKLIGKTVDYDKILKLMFKTNISVQQLLICIDDKDKLLEMDIHANIISSLWKNIYFIPNSVIDLHSSSIVINIAPVIVKLMNLVKNLKYHQDLFRKNYNISKSSSIGSKLNIPKSNLNLKIDIAQFAKFTRQLDKILEEDEEIFKLKFYLINRLSSVLYYSIGDANGGGLYINLKVDDSGISSLDYAEDEIEDNQAMKDIDIHVKIKPEKENNDLHYYEGRSILQMYIPLFIFSTKKSLFSEESQIWVSTIQTIKPEDRQKEERFLENIQLTFDIGSPIQFKSLELLFCRSFIESIDYFNIHGKQEDHDPSEYVISAETTPFDRQRYNVSGRLELNNVFSLYTYYYEDNDYLKSKYKEIFAKNTSTSTTEILSYLNFKIESISFKIVGKDNADIYRIIDNIKFYSELYQSLLDEMITIQNTHEQTAELDSKPQQEDHHSFGNTIYLKKSSHTINCIIDKVSFKFYYESKNTHTNLMAFIVINYISYNENMYSIDSNHEIKILDNLFISGIKLILSIPAYFRNKKDFYQHDRIPLWTAQKMEEIFTQMENQENKLVVLIVRNIYFKYTVTIHSLDPRVSFIIGDMIKLGFAKRKGEKVRPEDVDEIDNVLLSIVSKKQLEREGIIIEEVTQNLNVYGKEKIKREFTQVQQIWLDAMNYMVSLDHFITDNCFEVTISKKKDKDKEKDKSSSTSDIVNFNNEKDHELFGKLKHSLKIISSLSNPGSRYKLRLHLSLILIEIPSNIFSYIYYLKNYIIETQLMISRAFDEENNIRRLKAGSSINVKKQILTLKTQPLTKRKSEFLNKLLTNFSLGSISPKISVTKKIGYRRISRRKSAKYRIDEFSQLQKKITPLIKISVPYVSICIKQLADMKYITLAYFSLIQIKGVLSICKEFPIEDKLTLKVSNIKWKSESVRYKELLRNNGFNEVLTVTIMLNKEVKDKVIMAEVDGLDFIFVNKCVKELILFIEQNSECLKENPLEADRESILTARKNEPKTIVTLELKNTISVIFPESSQSANYICINIAEGRIEIQKCDQAPSILLSKIPLQIIDKKAIFNLKSIQAEENEYIPHTRIEITGTEIEAFFCINNQYTSLASLNEINLTVNAPANDSLLTKIRKMEWESKWKTPIVCYKPRVSLGVVGGSLNTSVVRK